MELENRPVRRVFPFRGAAIAAASLWLAAGAAAGDWPLFRNDPARTGYTSEQAYPPLSQAWSFEIQGDVTAGPVVYGGVVYAAARTGDLYALDARTGELLWNFSSDDWIDASPAVSSSAVYAAGRDGRLYALDRFTGAQLWRAELGGPSSSSPLYYEGRVYAGVSAPARKLKAFDASTGAALWEVQTAQPVDSAPSTDGAAVYFGSNDGRIYAMSPAAGAPVWPAPGYYQTLGSFGPAAIPAAGGSLYALPGHDERKLIRLLAAGGSQAAVSSPFAQTVDEFSNPEASENEVASPVLSPYGVYAAAGSRPHALYAFDGTSLEDLVFSSPTAGNTAGTGLVSSPAMANEVLYLGTADARLIAVSSAGAALGAAVTLSSSSFSSPAVSNGYVYLGVQGGRLLAYKAARITSISYPGRYDLAEGTVAVRICLRSPAMSGYDLLYGEGESPSSWTRISSASVSSEMADAAAGGWDTSQLPNGLYTLRLLAIESSPSGTMARADALARVSHKPLPPSGLAAADEPADSGNRLRLSWTATPSAWATAYRIYRGPAGGQLSYLAQISTPAATYLDATAVTGSTFAYAVAAYDGYTESDLSSQASAFSLNNNPSSDATPPSAPAGLSAASGGAGGSVQLSWTAPGNDGNVGAASGYEIRYATWPSFAWASGRVWRSSRTVAGPYGTAETENVSGLYGGVTYYFTLKAYDGNANYSAAPAAAGAAAARDFVPPGAPSVLIAEDTPGDHGGSLTLSWNLSADDGAGAGDVYGYHIFRTQASGEQVSTAPYASVGAGYAVYTDTSAPENIKYYYTVAAFDSTNDSPMTDEAYGVSADNWRFFDASNGGTVRLADGAEVSVPGHAASQNDNILVLRRPRTDYFGVSARVSADTGGAIPTGIVYEVKFENPATRLTKPATLALPYTSSDLGGIPESSLRVYMLDGSRWALLTNSRVRPELGKVTAEVQHFSVYSLMGYVPSGAVLSGESVYTYPNPARGDTLTFKFLPAYDSYVTVEVYNVAGEKVARLEKSSCPGGTVSELVWNIRNIASGVYVYRVEALSQAGSKAVTKKLAVIH